MVRRTGASVAAGAVLSVFLAGAVAPAFGVALAAAPADGSTGVVPDVATAAADEATDQPESSLVELPVVVPEVAGGEVAETAELSAALADDEVVGAPDVIAGDRVATEVVDTTDAQTLGVTWPDGVDGAALEPQLRILTDGEWSEWREIGEDSPAPDPGTADAANAATMPEVRGGTEAVWIGDAEAVQLSFAPAEGAADDLNLVLVGSEEVPLPANDALVGEVTVDATSASFGTGGPLAAAGEAISVIPRSAWGAAPQVCTPDVASTLVGAVVHHTAGSNTYATQAQAMQQIRNDQRYHIQSRGWCDLGYNFVVDKWGYVYEGRANSLNQPVIGVHAGGFNTGTVGISMLGTYTDPPTAAVQRSVAQIIGFRLAAYGVNPQGTMTYWTGNGENSKFQNQNVTLPRVFGHRDVAYTACPGNGGYSVLPAIRAMADDFSYGERFRQAVPVVRALYADFLGRQPDTSGLTHWSAQLVSGVGLPTLVAVLTDSDEYVRLRITQAYQSVVGRAPDTGGMAYWYDRIRTRTATVDDVARRFYDTDEFQRRAGDTTEGYVDLLYQTILGRAAKASEAEYWTGVIEADGRTTAVDAIWFSMEAARYRAAVYYRTLLGREPDAGGLESWARVLLDAGEGAVRAGIGGSEEYRRLAIADYS